MGKPRFFFGKASRAFRFVYPWAPKPHERSATNSKYVWKTYLESDTFYPDLLFVTVRKKRSSLRFLMRAFLSDRGYRWVCGMSDRVRLMCNARKKRSFKEFVGRSLLNKHNNDAIIDDKHP